MTISLICNYTSKAENHYCTKLLAIYSEPLKTLGEKKKKKQILLLKSSFTQSWPHFSISYLLLGVCFCNGINSCGFFCFSFFSFFGSLSCVLDFLLEGAAKSSSVWERATNFNGFSYILWSK